MDQGWLRVLGSGTESLPDILSAWLNAMLSGALDGFYSALRWPDWEAEVGALGCDQGIHTWPPPWTAEGKDLSMASRKTVPLTELLSLFSPG